jgi:hypothetical protein
VEAPKIIISENKKETDINIDPPDEDITFYPF